MADTRSFFQNARDNIIQAAGLETCVMFGIVTDAVVVNSLRYRTHTEEGNDIEKGEIRHIAVLLGGTTSTTHLLRILE